MIIDSNTKLYGIFGNPVSHSLSPVMHNSAFKHVKYNGAYLAFKITDIKKAVSAIKSLNIKGVSVTIPHKISIMDYLDEISSDAQKIGAVNTVINHKGILKGYNSDSLGAVAALEEKTKIVGKNAAIIGAGGAARAIGFGIQNKGVKVTIVNRSSNKGEKLAKDLNAQFLPLTDFKSCKFDILINTTPLGMFPNINAMPVNSKILEPGICVMDIVYNPLETKFLKQAQNKGCTTINGIAMFVYQGAFQFEVWTGKKAPVDLMKNIVIKSLG